MSTLSTHVLDTGLGRPAAGIALIFNAVEDKKGEGDYGYSTDADGRCRLDVKLYEGGYRLTFLVGDYFAAQGRPTLYPEIVITFEVDEAEPHYHIPLLLSPYGYTTYRGS